MGKSIYRLDLNLVFENATLLMKDPDDYVQKSIGWVLKVTSVYHPNEVKSYLIEHKQKMKKHTFRYAIEKYDPDTRKALLAEH